MFYCAGFIASARRSNLNNTMSNFSAASWITPAHYAELIKICSAFSDYVTYFTPKIRGLKDFKSLASYLQAQTQPIYPQLQSNFWVCGFSHLTQPFRDIISISRRWLLSSSQDYNLSTQTGISLFVKFHSSFWCNLLIYPIWLEAVLNILSVSPP